MARILIVDDEELVRYTMREILEECGHEVTEAKNGNECLALQKSTPFDLVITDIIMPEKEGIETIIELKRDYPELKVLAFSGGGRTRHFDYLEKAKEHGADEILPKPFTEKTIMALVDSLLSRA